jgi:hypothetical protein
MHLSGEERFRGILCAASFRDGVDYNLPIWGPDFTVEPHESLSRLTCERCSTAGIRRRFTFLWHLVPPISAHPKGRQANALPVASGP